MLGIARRAGLIVLGTRAVRGALRKGRVHLLIVAKDASANALARLGSEGRNVPQMRLGTREILGKAVGRGEMVVAGITDSDLATKLSLDNEAQIKRRSNFGAGRDLKRQAT
jgi:ribosomal protein L7Ae-like RNA K-turn-binding protein